jgi:hypothetical protein
MCSVGLCRESSVAAVRGPAVVSANDAEMICSERSQPRDVRADILVHVPGLALGGTYVPVRGGRTILEINSSGQSVRIDCAIECRCISCDICRWVRNYHRWPGGAERGKGPIAAVCGAGAVGRDYTEMIRSARS